MKKIFIMVILFLSAGAEAGEGPFALGVVLGEPTGFSGRYDLSASRFVDGGLAWSGDGAHMYGNYLLNFPHRYLLGQQPMDLYYGLGLRLVSISTDKNKNKIAIAPRAPIGTALSMSDPDLQFFGEAALNMNLTPETSADLDLGIGVRYRF